MQGIDALGYEEVMTFLRSTPANLFFKDTECRYLFISDVKTFFPYGEGQEKDVLGKCSATRFLRNRDRIVEKNSPILRSISEARPLAWAAPLAGGRLTQEGGLF